MPISAPVKAARSMAKLLSSACQVEKLRGAAAAKISSRISGLFQPPAPMALMFCHPRMASI
jgi:hypothetical protein